MPEIPDRFPYETNEICEICEKAKMSCKAEYAFAGLQVQRMLECPNCSATSQDVYDKQRKEVVTNHRKQNPLLPQR